MGEVEILVVESDVKIRALLTRFLGACGYALTVATDGRAGVEAFGAGTPALVLVNVTLQDGLTGFEVCATVREQRPELPVIIMGSARQARAFAARGQASEGVRFLVKPFAAKDLLATIKEALDTRASATATASEQPAEPGPLPTLQSLDRMPALKVGVADAPTGATPADESGSAQPAAEVELDAAEVEASAAAEPEREPAVTAAESAELDDDALGSQELLNFDLTDIGDSLADVAYAKWREHYATSMTQQPSEEALDDARAAKAARAQDPSSTGDGPTESMMAFGPLAPLGPSESLAQFATEPSGVFDFTFGPEAEVDAAALVPNLASDPAAAVAPEPFDEAEGAESREAVASTAPGRGGEETSFADLFDDDDVPEGSLFPLDVDFDAALDLLEDSSSPGFSSSDGMASDGAAFGGFEEAESGPVEASVDPREAEIRALLSPMDAIEDVSEAELEPPVDLETSVSQMEASMDQALESLVAERASSGRTRRRDTGALLQIRLPTPASDEGALWSGDDLEEEEALHRANGYAADIAQFKFVPMEPDSPSAPRGIYGDLTCATLLYNLFRDLFSGRLVLCRGRCRKTVFFVNGHPVFAESNIRSESLGFQLRRDGTISDAQHQQSLERADTDSLKYGEALVELGFVDRKTLNTHLRRQVQERLLNCFGWMGAQYGLIYDPDVSQLVDVFEVNPVALIFRGIKTAFPLAALVNKFDDYCRRTARKTERLRDYLPILKDYEAELKLGELCDGKRAFGEIIAESHLSFSDTIRALAALETVQCISFGKARSGARAAAGRRSARPARTTRSGGGFRRGVMGGARKGAGGREAVKAESRPAASTSRSTPRPAAGKTRSTPPAAAARPKRVTTGGRAVRSGGRESLKDQLKKKLAGMEKATFRELLEIDDAADEAAIRAAGKQLQRRFHPNRMVSFEDPELVEGAKQLVVMLRKAVERLVAYEKSAGKNQGPDIMKAEKAFNEGKLSLRKKDNAEALAQFETACGRDPHQAVYRMYRGWARFLAAAPTDRKARSVAHDEIRAALLADGTSDEGFVLLAHVYKATGHLDMAAKFYTKALSLNRRNTAASRALRGIEEREMRQSKDASGIFSKLFTRNR